MQIIDDPKYPKCEMNNKEGYTVRYLFINKRGEKKMIAAIMWGNKQRALTTAKDLINKGKQEVQVYRGYFGGWI